MGTAVAVSTTQIIIEMGKQDRKKGKAVQDKINKAFQQKPKK